MSKVAKSALVLIIATMAAKVLGFMRELALASTYGTTMYSDAYLIAIGIPSIIFTAIGASIATTFIPMYLDREQKYGEEESLKFTNNIIHIVLIVSIIIGLIGFLFTEQIVKIFAVGFNEEAFNLTVKFTKMLILGIIFTGLSSIMTAYLQVKNNFTIPGLIAIPKNIIIISSIILSSKFGLYIMIWGYLIGMISEFLFQVPFAINSGYRYKAYLNIGDDYVKKMVWLLGPVLIGVGVNQINAMVDRSLASTLVEGSISALNYANKLNNFVTALFISSIVAIIYPILSKLSSQDDKQEFVDIIVKSANSVILLVMPISIGAIVLSKPIVRFLFQRGEFDDRATSMTAIALIFYSIGMVAFGLRDVIGKVFYSLQDTKTPMINGAISLGLNIVFNLIAIRVMGHAGLALGTSLSAIVCIILLLFSLKKKIGYFGQDKILKATAKAISSAIIMGVTTYFVYKILNSILGEEFIMQIISLSGSIGIGVIVYGTLVVMLKVEEVNIIIDMFKSKLSKNKKYKKSLSN